MEIIRRRLNRIEVKDEYYFEYNMHAMECCFGEIGSSYYQFAVKDTHDGCRAWFPFEEEKDFKLNQIISGSKNVNWKNHLEKDGDKIIQWLYDGEPMHNNKNDLPTLEGYDTIPSHTFLRKNGLTIIIITNT